LMYSIAKEDPMNFYYNYLHTDPVKPYNGYSPALGVKDPELDRLLDIVAAESDLKKRKEAFKKVVLRSNDKVYWLPHMAQIIANGWSDKLKNFNPQNYFQPEEAFQEAWI